MPFAGGGGGQLSNHVHDNTPLQGGPLQFNGTTIGGMNAGDITYSDGAALQTLAFPGVPAGETLTAAAASTSPSWVAGSGSLYELITSVQLGADATNITASFAAVSQSDISHILAVFNGRGNVGNNTYLRVNGLASNYDLDGVGYVASVRYDENLNGATQWNGFPDWVGDESVCYFNLTCNPVTEHIQCSANVCGNLGWENWSGTNTTAAQTSISSVDLFPSGGNTIKDGSRLDVYKILI